MRFLLLILASLFLVSCGKSYEFDSVAALKWSESNDAQKREIAASYSFLREDSTWIVITTAQMEESQEALTYAGGRILKSGFLVYPGGVEVSTIQEAIEIGYKTPGANYTDSKN